MIDLYLWRIDAQKMFNGYMTEHRTDKHTLGAVTGKVTDVMIRFALLKVAEQEELKYSKE